MEDQGPSNKNSQGRPGPCTCPPTPAGLSALCAPPFHAGPHPKKLWPRGGGVGSSARCPPPCPSNLSVHPSALCRGPRPGPSLPGQMAAPFLPGPVAGEALRSRLAGSGWRVATSCCLGCVCARGEAVRVFWPERLQEGRRWPRAASSQNSLPFLPPRDPQTPHLSLPCHHMGCPLRLAQQGSLLGLRGHAGPRNRASTRGSTSTSSASLAARPPVSPQPPKPQPQALDLASVSEPSQPMATSDPARP